MQMRTNREEIRECYLITLFIEMNWGSTKTSLRRSLDASSFRVLLGALYRDCDEIHMT